VRINQRTFSKQLPLITAFLLAPLALRGQGVSETIDNFKTGLGKVGPITSGSVTVNQAGGGIVGGTRTVMLYEPPDSNPYNQTTSAQVIHSQAANVPSALVWSSGYANFAALYLTYGNSASLNLDFLPYDRFRVSFAGVDQYVNFNFEAWDSSNAYAVCGTNVPVTPYPFTVDFPFSQMGGASLDWSAIERLDLLFQGGNLGAPSLAVTGIEVVLGSTYPAATYTCGGTE
jgi:hypothetical protein